MKKSLYLFSLALTPLLMAETMSFQEQVHVSSSKPEYRMITTRVPHQECWDEQVQTQYAPPPSTNNGSSGVVGGVLGGVAGGVLGHQIGGGSGKTAATVGGAIVGTLVGKSIAESNDQSAQQQPSTYYRTERRCETRYEEKAQEQFMGYKNVATYKNQTIVKYSDKPLEYIPLNVTVNY